jgi:hypothetical protein
MESNKRVSIREQFYESVAVSAELADTSDFEESEIRCLAPLNPVPYSRIEEWDGILRKKAPIHGDLGINKERKIFWYTMNSGWKNIL